MIKIYTLVSDGQPLAQVRTDGHRMEFLNDKTDGHINNLAGNDFKRLRAICQKSSHLRLLAPNAPASNVLRYRLNNGDVVEITTDGASCLVNGTLLDEQEKQALFLAIRQGELSIVQKPDAAVPVYSKVAGQDLRQAEDKGINKELLAAHTAISREEHDKRHSGTSDYDPQIEQMDVKQYDVLDPNGIKRLAYQLKHGAVPGERNGRK